MSRKGNLFVYGTLRSGLANPFATKLQNSERLLGRARLKGRLYLIADYPGCVPSEHEGEWVHGEVYELKTPDATYQMLDDYEGCGAHDRGPHEFRRVILPVQLDSGRWIDASVYIFTQDVSTKQRIETGDFLIQH